MSSRNVPPRHKELLWSRVGFLWAKKVNKKRREKTIRGGLVCFLKNLAGYLIIKRSGLLIVIVVMALVGNKHKWELTCCPVQSNRPLFHYNYFERRRNLTSESSEKNSELQVRIQPRSHLSPEIISLGSKPPMLTRTARTGVETRLVRIELTTFASRCHQFEPKRDVTTRRDPPLSFFGEICVDSQPARRVASNRCEKSRNVTLTLTSGAQTTELREALWSAMSTEM